MPQTTASTITEAELNSMIEMAVKHASSAHHLADRCLLSSTALRIADLISTKPEALAEIGKKSSLVAYYVASNLDGATITMFTSTMMLELAHNSSISAVLLMATFETILEPMSPEQQAIYEEKTRHHKEDLKAAFSPFPR